MNPASSPAIVPTRYWHPLDDGRIQCDLCPRFCKLHEGQRGFCFVRACQDGQIVLTTYGRSSGFCVDPIEKKPLYHFLPGTPVLSFGTAGCNLGCSFCVHPDTLIATTGGLRRIADLFDACAEQVALGDGCVGFPTSLEVWTREAKQAPVAKVFARPYLGELLAIKGSCCPLILLTPNHKVFAAHRSNLEDIHQLPAEQLSAEHYLVVPKRRPGSDTRISVRDILAGRSCGAHAARTRRIAGAHLATVLGSPGTSAELGSALGYHPAYVRKLRGQLARGVLAAPEERPARLVENEGRVRFLGEHGPGIPASLDLTPDLAWLLGFYCAEGHVSAHPRRPNSYHLVFSCGRHEQFLISQTAKLLTELFGVRPQIVSRRTTFTIECGQSSVARFFEALCGRGAKNKRVPPLLMHATESVIRAFLDGYLAGDGYVAPTQVVGNTVSAQLAFGLYELGLHLDLWPTFFIHQPAATKLIEGREVCQAKFIVKFKRDRFQSGEPGKNERTSWRDVGNAFLVPVRCIERVSYSGMVYNLEVDDPGHSYLAPFLAVGNCQNWDISKSREIDTLSDEASPQAIAETAVRLDCRSVAFTYNDPVIFHEYAIDVARACREREIKAVAVTAGEVCAEPREEFYRYMDAANVDIKGFTETFYHKICAGHLQPVLETLVYLVKQTAVHVEVTTLIIPGLNDSDAELEDLTRWVVENLGPDVPLHFTAFHPDFRLRDRPPTPPETLRRARQIARRNGVRHAYVGNVHDPEADSTFCHECGTLLIGRDWYEITAWRLDRGNRCPGCGAVCAGVLEEKPGGWGRQRLPLRLRSFEN
jgi:pyruvate formate lyase activating enzyme